MGSFPEVRSKDARAQAIRHHMLTVLGSFIGHAILHHQRILAPESENFRVDGNTGVVYTIRPIVPFPQNYLHRPRI